MTIRRDEIAALIPHAGAMCLLDSVDYWDETVIHCLSATHRAADNPLSEGGRLSAVCGVEYAVQAMALHGRLARLTGDPRAGYLASIRDMTCHVPYLDSLDGDLSIEAELLLGEKERVIYRFALRSGGADIVTGRAAVVLDATAA